MRKLTLAIALVASIHLSAYGKVAEARAVIVKGNVTNSEPDSPLEGPVTPNAEIEVGSTIGTGGDSSLLMEPTPGSAVMVLEKSRVVLAEDDLKKKGETILGRKTVLDLTKGKVQCALPHMSNGGTDFKVKTPQCVAAARGTVYEVFSNGKSTTTVCSQGTVRVSWIKNGVKVFEDVPAGMQLIVNADGSSTLEPATAAELADLNAFSQGSALALGEGGGKDIPGGINPIGGGPDTPQGPPGGGDPGSTGVIQTSGTTKVITSGSTASLTVFPSQETQVTNQ